MYGNILSFELHHRFKKISTYIYFMIFLLFGIIAIYRGSMGHGFLRRLTNAGVGNVNANAPYALYYLITFLSHYGILITAAFFGKAAHRDFNENTYGLYFSYPIKKIDYLAGRFSGAAISCLFVFSGVGMGAFLASISPILTNSEKIGSIHLFTYIQPYLTGVLPNVLFAGILFFSLALMTRKFISIYLGIIVLLIGYMVGASLRQSLESNFIASLIDPFGHLAVRDIFSYWTTAQRNSYLIPLSGDHLLNRLVWIFLGVGLFMLTYKNFRFSHIIELKKRKPNHSKQAVKKRSEILNLNILNVESTQIFSLKNKIRQMLHTMLHEFKGITKNVYFLIILILGTAFIFIRGFRNVGLVLGIQTHPVTSQVLQVTQTTLYLFSVVVILFCSGELVWRERNKKVHEMSDALPIPEWIPFVGKLGTMIFIQVLMMLIVLFSGIMIQVLNSYYHFQLGLYLKELFGIRFMYYLLISVFAIFIQIIVNKKFLGYLITILFIDDFMVSIGLEHRLWTFAATPSYTYSDMNGYGPFMKSILCYNSFWCSLGILLIVLSIGFWVRGNDTNLKDRIKTLRTRITKTKLMVSAAGFLSCIMTASFVVYNTTILNRFESTKTIEKMSVTYEKAYKKFENTPQPRITDIKVDVAMYPYQRRVTSRGRMILKNKTDFDIIDLFIQAPDPDEGRVNELRLDVSCYLIEASNDYGSYVYKLNRPMRSSEEICLYFDIELTAKGFKDKNINTRLVKNGTFLTWSQIMPEIVYNSEYELGDNDKRKKYGLEPKGRVASIADNKAKMNHYVNRDADWINFEAVVSTSKDQTALTSGELISEWVEGERHYFHYKTQGEILKFFPFVSARYHVKKDRWQDIGIEVFYHGGHEYNLDLMIKAVKRSFDYYTKNFSPYQFKQIRIVEFPRYQIFAQSFPSLIPFSEGAGFIAKRDTTRLDYFFKIVAHEVGHQWWAHQVIGANVQGLTLMSEGLAQYSALMVIKKEYDQARINEYVKYELEVYLRGRARETQKEVPLYLVENQGYIHYGKGLVVMNAVQDYIGENNLNAALRKYIEKVGFQEPPYTISLEFIRYLKEATPDSLEYIITDMFETITLYQNRAIKATYKKLEKGQYLVKFEYEAIKLRADEQGNERTIQISDYITFGIFGAQGEELYLKKHFVGSEKSVLEFVVDDVPEKAGIDPYYFLIDKHTDDNVINVTRE